MAWTDLLIFKKYDIQIIHQTGLKNYDETVKELKKIYPEYTENSQYIIRPYFKKMYLPMIASDIAVSRAGSLSISEICVSGLASILIPYPYAAADHQRKNAKEMEELGAALYLDDSQCTVESFTEKLEELIANKENNKSIIFVGDGINDAPVLTRADVGIAMGGLGSDAAIEAADAVIMDDKPSKIAKAILIAKKTMSIVKQNIIFALTIKALFLTLGAYGFVTMWGAVFADTGVALLAVVNSLRALKS